MQFLFFLSLRQIVNLLYYHEILILSMVFIAQIYEIWMKISKPKKKKNIKQTEIIKKRLKFYLKIVHNSFFAQNRTISTVQNSLKKNNNKKNYFPEIICKSLVSPDQAN